MLVKISSHLPVNLLANEELATIFPGWTAEKIFEKTGVLNRRVAAPSECASDLAYFAAEALFQSEDRNVDWLLFCTQTPDFRLPTSACILQHRLKLSTACAALDFNLGCSGYIYGLSLANSLLTSNAANRVLLLTGDTYTRLIHPLDKSTRTIFGDAGTATLLENRARSRLHSFVLGTDGSGATQLMVKAGGARFSPSGSNQTVTDDSGNVHDPACLYMNGPEVFNFTLKAVPKLVREVLALANLELGEVDLVVFHQANAFMLEHLRRKLGISPERFIIHLKHTGNTVSSTIPLALEYALNSARLRPGMKVLLAGFGVGYSWGGCILEWN